MSQSSGWNCKSSGSWVELSKLLSELELDTSSSAKSCLLDTYNNKQIAAV